jgi:hypothetical protein
MSTEGWVILLLVLVLLVAGGWYLAQQQKRKRLSGRFGPEYDRTVREAGSRSAAERALTEREERVAALQIRALNADERRRYSEEWRQVQARFVDEPRRAVEDGDRLIAEVMQRRGYPVADFDRRVEDLSVQHPVVVQHYRAGRDLALRSREGRASTEDLRQAMVHYRALFTDLLRESVGQEREAARPGSMDKPGKRSSKIKEVKYDRPK